MISTFTAFFDANIFFGARLRSLVVELAQSGLFRARWSENVHREWIDAVANARPGIARASLERVSQLMNAAVLESVVSGYEPLLEALSLPDEKDRHILAAAVVARASVIVTFNERDFPPAALAPFGIHTRHPDQFILDIEGLDPGLFIARIETDLAHYASPPLSFASYCMDLRAAGLPKTADHLQQLEVLFPSPGFGG